MTMTRTLTSTALALLLCATAPAATTDTTLTVHATVTSGPNGLSASGTATLTNIGNGSFTRNVPITALTENTITAPFTITISGSTLTGALSIPATLVTSLLTGSASGTASA